MVEIRKILSLVLAMEIVPAALSGRFSHFWVVCLHWWSLPVFQVKTQMQTPCRSVRGLRRALSILYSCLENSSFLRPLPGSGLICLTQGIWWPLLGFCFHVMLLGNSLRQLAGEIIDFTSFGYSLSDWKSLFLICWSIFSCLRYNGIPYAF